MPAVFDQPSRVKSTSVGPVPPARIAGRRAVPKASRTGRGAAWAKSATSTRSPNSISRVRFMDSWARSAEIRATRYVLYPSADITARINRATSTSMSVKPEA